MKNPFTNIIKKFNGVFQKSVTRAEVVQDKKENKPPEQIKEEKKVKISERIQHIRHDPPFTELQRRVKLRRKRYIKNKIQKHSRIINRKSYG